MEITNRVFIVNLFVICWNSKQFASQQTDVSSFHNCQISKVNDTTNDDVEALYNRFTKRYTGKVSFMGDYPYGITTCQLDPLPPMQTAKDWIPVAVAPKDYIHSLFCGTCLKISPRNRSLTEQRSFTRKLSDNTISKTLYATVVDQCPHCQPGEMKLYKEGEGTHNIIYEAIDCKEIPGPDGLLKMRFGKCNDNKRMKIQVKNMKIPVTELEFYQKEKWLCTKRSSDNYYFLDGGAENFTFPMKGRISAVNGQLLSFSLDSIDSDKETTIPIQFDTFESGIHLLAGMEKTIPHLRCSITKSHLPKKEELDDLQSFVSILKPEKTDKSEKPDIQPKASPVTAKTAESISYVNNEGVHQATTHASDITEEQPSGNSAAVELCKETLTGKFVFLGDCEKYLFLF